MQHLSCIVQPDTFLHTNRRFCFVAKQQALTSEQGMPTSRQRLPLMTPRADCLVKPFAVQALYPLHRQARPTLLNSRCRGVTHSHLCKLTAKRASSLSGSCDRHKRRRQPARLLKTRHPCCTADAMGSYKVVCTSWQQTMHTCR